LLLILKSHGLVLARITRFILG